MAAVLVLLLHQFEASQGARRTRQTWRLGWLSVALHAGAHGTHSTPMLSPPLSSLADMVYGRYAVPLNLWSRAAGKQENKSANEAANQLM